MMHRANAFWILLALTSATGCAVVSTRGPAPTARASDGSAAPATTLAIDVGVADVYLVVGLPGDSVRWVLRTAPDGCATVRATRGRLTLTDRARQCTVTLDISAPALSDISVRASVGNIDLTAPLDRAVRLRTDVGRVVLRVNDRELRATERSGSGDDLQLGDMGSLPRLDARTGVGRVTAHLRTTARPDS